MINWASFGIVALATLIGAVTVVGMYSLGVRLWAVSADAGTSAHRTARSGAIACFAVCGAAVLYGIYLIVPFFH
ncbi:hypothetical protein [Arthrobacter sp. 35W]|uniref:hypothetical protein n=1 Tax=Arthrobacter sp. 35W TaxID=1132441 RepID=UPI00040D7749|nr:hypothetical protein [Arthrobacter sp. 35W]